MRREVTSNIKEAARFLDEQARSKNKERGGIGGLAAVSAAVGMHELPLRTVLLPSISNDLMASLFAGSTPQQCNFQ
jgi:hypothetical protein